jgi:long-chain acyl-CoA synthetase
LKSSLKKFLSPEVLDAFVRDTVETQPAGAASSLPSCESLGNDWLRIGIRPGDLVLLCLPNGKQLLNHFFGVLMAGGVPALLPPGLPAARLRDISAAMGARAIGAIRLPHGELRANQFVEISGLHIALLPCSAEPAAAAGQVVVLTSGTSGTASGCVFDVESLLLNGQRHAEAIGQREEDVVLVNLPLYFSFALVAQALASLVCGNRIVISGPPFNSTLHQKTLRDYGVTISSLTPVLVRSMLQSDANSLNQLRVLTVGGDALEPEMVARLLQIRDGGELYITYGLTQAGPRVSTLAAHAEPPRRYSSVGRPLSGTNVFLRSVAGARDLNQLYVTSETVMNRAIGRVEGRPDYEPVAGTIATGDAFQQDNEGYLYFAGRLSDYISRKGEKVSLAAVRRMVSQLPQVFSAKTIVVEHKEGGEDFDLELCLNDGIETPVDPREMLRGVLRKTELPRAIRVEAAKEMSTHRFK